MPDAAFADAGWTLSGVQARSGRHVWPASPLTLSIPAGHTSILGLSGAGKTTLLNLLVGYVKPSLGTIAGPGRMAWVPQDHGLWLAHTVREHLTLAGARGPEAASFLSAFDLTELADQRADRLSHGESARVAVARALAQDAPAIVMDEPLAHVDNARAGKYWREIRARIAGRSVVIATHQPEVALGLGGISICLSEGAVVYAGPVSALYHEPPTAELASRLGPANWFTPEDAELWLDHRWSAARCVRPERLRIESSEAGCEVIRSEFLGNHVETELRHRSGHIKTFFHRSICELPIGSTVRLQEIPSHA